MRSIKFKKREQLWIGNTDWSAIFNDPYFSTEYFNKVIDKIKNGITYDDMQDSIRKAGEYQAAATYDDFNKHLLLAGRETSTTTKKKCEGWYWYSREKLSPIIAEKNTLLH